MCIPHVNCIVGMPVTVVGMLHLVSSKQWLGLQGFANCGMVVQ